MMNTRRVEPLGRARAHLVPMDAVAEAALVVAAPTRAPRCAPRGKEGGGGTGRTSSGVARALESMPRFRYVTTEVLCNDDQQSSAQGAAPEVSCSTWRKQGSHPALMAT